MAGSCARVDTMTSALRLWTAGGTRYPTARASLLKGSVLQTILEPMPDNLVTDNPDRHRYEMPVEGRTAFATYRRDPGRLLVPHVEAPPELQGRGVAGRLMEGIVAAVRADGVKLTPLCGYAAAWM